MIRFNKLTNEFYRDRSMCAKCKQKIKEGALEPVLFSHDYYHYRCLTHKTIKEVLRC